MALLSEKKQSIFQHNHFIGFVESFESLVDLFTILSFVLIAAVFFFGIQRMQTQEDYVTAEFELKEVIEGGAPPSSLPDDIVVIFITKESGSDIVQFIKKDSKIIKYYPSKVNIEHILENELQGIGFPKKLNIVAIDGPQKLNFHLLYKIQKWLAINGFNNVKIYFT